MIKMLHSADWHLDSQMTGHSPENAQRLSRELEKLPERIVQLAKKEGCQAILLAGDLFDSIPSLTTVRNVQQVLANADMPVLIIPGNHDYLTPDSPYLMEDWPENVHIFREQKIQSISIPELDCRFYGAAYTARECPALYKGFHAAGEEKYHIALHHGDVDNANSAYCPITREHLRGSGLTYVAAGHIHKGGSLHAGQTLCAWPGCPMGRGFDELGAKGVIVLTLEDTASTAFFPLDTLQFHDEKLDVGEDAYATLGGYLPSLPTGDFYRITLTGYSAPLDAEQLAARFSHIPNLILRDQTLPEMDLWSAAGEDSFEGVYFNLLRQASQSDSPALQKKALLAARISRQILDGQEVKLP